MLHRYVLWHVRTVRDRSTLAPARALLSLVLACVALAARKCPAARRRRRLAVRALEIAKVTEAVAIGERRRGRRREGFVRIARAARVGPREGPEAIILGTPFSAVTPFRARQRRPERTSSSSDANGSANGLGLDATASEPGENES
jgi:hypothetical protein